MPLLGPDGQALVFAPGVDNAGTIARRLREGGVACLVCDDLAAFEAELADRSERLGAVVVTWLGVRDGAGAAIARFKFDEPAWSALPVVLLAPPGAAVVPPWGHTTLVTQPTTIRQLVDVVARAIEARSHHHLLASRSRELRQVAFQDALTGLPNRSALYERIRELQAERRGSAGTFAALFVDLDGFKAINDAHGHLVGDEVLRQVAAHLVAAVRAQDKLLLAWIAPRGIVAAATASLFGPALVEAGYPDAERLLPFAFLIILATVLAHGFAIGPLTRRLGLAAQRASGLLVVGASPWTRAPTGELRQQGVDVLVADGAYAHLQPLQADGVPVLYGEVLSEEAEEELETLHLSHLLCATDNDFYNALVCKAWGARFGLHRSLQLATHQESSDAAKRMTLQQRGYLAFDRAADYETLQRRLDDGWTVQTT